MEAIVLVLATLAIFICPNFSARFFNRTFCTKYFPSVNFSSVVAAPPHIWLIAICFGIVVNVGREITNTDVVALAAAGFLEANSYVFAAVKSTFRWGGSMNIGEAGKEGEENENGGE